MKKTFVNPEMNISLFDMENVLTASGSTEPAVPSNMEAATTAIGTVSAVSDIVWTF